MKKLTPWIGGAIIGMLISGVIAGILLVASIFDDQPDPAYEMVATSWGTRVDSPDHWRYQIQVIAQDYDQDGVLEVTGRGCIGSSSYYHDFGSLGTATNMGEAVQKFGDIIWEDDRVTIGGSGGVVASVKRAQLEKHR